MKILINVKASWEKKKKKRLLNFHTENKIYIWRYEEYQDKNITSMSKKKNIYNNKIFNILKMCINNYIKINYEKYK